MRKKAASGVLASLRGSTVRPGQTPVPTGDGWAGENNLRFASSLAAALAVELRVLARWGGRVKTKAFLRILHG